MKIKDYICKKCGRDNFFLERFGFHYGIYCSYCGRWYKWANKGEIILFHREVINEYKFYKNT